MKLHKQSSPVSRYGTSSKRAMARAIKQPREKRSVVSLLAFLRSVFLFVRHHWMIFSGGVVILIFIGISLFTPIFTLRAYSITLDERAGCLNEAYVREYFSLHVHYFWDVFLFSDEELLAMHSCAQKFILTWTPFQFGSLDVRVLAHKPVFKVRIERVVADGAPLDTTRFLHAPVSGDDIRFMLSNGRIVILDSEPDIPEIVLRVYQGQSIDAIRFDRSYIVALLQLQGYFEKDFGDSVRFVVSDLGIVDVQTERISHIYVSLRDPLAEQLRSLQAFLGTSTINTSKLESIDVRYGYVAVRDRQ